jgi:hypothetical protein
MGNGWKPKTRGEIEMILLEELAGCTPEQRAAFERLRVPLRKAPIERYGRIDSVFIVARMGDEVMYYEDVEEGFERSPLDVKGRILRNGCNQDPLHVALVRWTGRS